MMRELKREECRLVSGGIDTSNLHTVFVDAPPSTGGAILNFSSGLSRRQANEACDLVGGVAKIAKKNPVTKGISPTAACKNGVKATINAEACYA